MANGVYSETVNMQGPPWTGELVVPQPALGLVLCLRHSTTALDRRRSQRAVEVLQMQGLACLSFDLLSAEEENRRKHLNTALLARRLDQAMDWVERRTELNRHRVGLFGANTAAAAAMRVAAERPHDVAALVLQESGGDLGLDTLAPVWGKTPLQVPTLLVVDAADAAALAHSRALLRRLGGPKRLEVAPCSASQCRSRLTRGCAGLGGELVRAPPASAARCLRRRIKRPLRATRGRLCPGGAPGQSG